jgi:hypothetical protein
MPTVPRGATTDAGANAYDMKFPVSPIFIKMNPDHLKQHFKDQGMIFQDRKTDHNFERK